MQALKSCTKKLNSCQVGPNGEAATLKCRLAKTNCDPCLGASQCFQINGIMLSCRWLSILSLERDQLPNSVEVKLASIAPQKSIPSEIGRNIAEFQTFQGPNSQGPGLMMPVMPAIASQSTSESQVSSSLWCSNAPVQRPLRMAF